MGRRLELGLRSGLRVLLIVDLGIGFEFRLIGVVLVLRRSLVGVLLADLELYRVDDLRSPVRRSLPLRDMLERRLVNENRQLVSGVATTAVTRVVHLGNELDRVVTLDQLAAGGGTVIDTQEREFEVDTLLAFSSFSLLNARDFDFGDFGFLLAAFTLVLDGEFLH